MGGADQTKDGAVVELEDQTREMREQWNRSGLAEQTNDGASDWMEEHVADRVERRVEWQTKWSDNSEEESDDSTQRRGTMA